MSKFHYLPKKEFTRRFGADTLGVHVEGSIYLPMKASTRVRLHELYHSLNPSNIDTSDELAYRELAAQQFAFEKMGNTTFAVEPVIFDLIAEGYSAATTMGAIMRGLNRLGCETTREQRHSWWNTIRHHYDNTRRK